MNSIGNDIDEFPDDVAATGSPVAIKNTLYIGKADRDRIIGLSGRSQHSQKKRHLIRPWAKRAPSGNYGCAKYTCLDRPSMPTGSTDGMSPSIDNIESEGEATMRYRAGGVGRALTTLSRTPRYTVARRTAFARRLYRGWRDSARRLALGILLLNESRGADILDVAHFMYLAVGGSIIVRIGDDLYMREELGLGKLGELTPSKILAQCALYSKMVAGLIRYIGSVGCVSRVEGDIY